MHVYVCCVQAWLIAIRRQSQCKMTNSICHDTTSSDLVHERETQVSSVVKISPSENIKLKSKVEMARGPVLHRRKQSSSALKPN